MKIVSLGGGTGLSTLLKGLKSFYPADPAPDLLEMVLEKAAGVEPLRVSDLSAVVAVSDDGGSSGRLRREFQVLPPGDIRNCMVALSEDEALLSRLFQFRFTSGKGLKGHSFGNLFLTALSGITGDFQEAIQVSSEVLAIRGHIYPSTMSDVRLEAELDNGRIAKGETQISRSRRPIKRLRLSPRSCRPVPKTLEAIAQADVITLGPGSLFTSLIPNLLVKGIVEAISESRAAKIFICNLMTQPGETSQFTAADHLRAVMDHAGGRKLFDYVLVNSGAISPSALRRYRARNSRPVIEGQLELEQTGVRVVSGDFVSEKSTGPAKERWVRHAPASLAKAVLETGAAHHYWGEAVAAAKPIRP
jgi:uncharacterized cofD-like protein